MSAPPRMVRRAGLIALAGLLLASGVAPAADAAPVGALTVFAAASLTDAFRAAADTLRRRHPDAVIQFNFAGSSTLARQLEEGARADVIATADGPTMQRLADGKLLAGAPVTLARNRLTIAVPAGNPAHVKDLADMGRAGLKIALGAPEVPVGRYAREAFAKAGVPVPPASNEVDVKAVLTKVGLGEVDAGIVYVTDVRAAAGKIEGVDIPEAHNVEVRCPIAALAHADNRAGADAFVHFLLSDDGQAVLVEQGFVGR